MIDPVTMGAIATVAAPIIGGAISSKSQNSANKTNVSIAKAQMDFQERMSNTSYQRAVTDMKQAGINPMLAYIQGGASSPAGSTTRVENSGQYLAKGLEESVHSGLQLAQYKKDLAQTDSNIALNEVAKQTQKTQQALNESNAKVAKQNAAVAKQNEAQLKAALPAIKEQSKLDAQRAKIDRKLLKYDATMQRIKQGVGIVHDAATVLKPKVNLNFGTKNYHKVHKKTGEILD